MGPPPARHAEARRAPGEGRPAASEGRRENASRPASVSAPDQCHDLHGIGGTCTGNLLAQQTDAYLKSTVDEIMRSDFWQRGANAIVVTFDEGSTDLGCCGANPGGGAWRPW